MDILISPQINLLDNSAEIDENSTFSSMKFFERDQVRIALGDALSLYQSWDKPTVIISDGPYGLASYPGDPASPDNLAECYEPHIKKWSELALPSTTIWFWNTELGWANVHHKFIEHGWEFRNCHIWDKGIGHIAGNSNSKTLRKYPVTTEVCVQYVKKVFFDVGNKKLSMRDWLRYEWERSGLPFSKTNEACGMKNAATRKYFTKDHLWYFPPPEAFEALAAYANKYGHPRGKPYFSLDGKKSIKAKDWSLMRAKFFCYNGTTNVWQLPAVRGIERLKENNQCIHMNQKPMKLIELCLKSSSEEGDVVWEPFGGLCTGAIASHKMKRKCFSSEIIKDYYLIAKKRLENYDVF